MGPVITSGQVAIEPFIFDALNANGTYSSGRATRYHWGGGAQVGMYYIHDCNWRLGASLKSPSWMEEFEFYGSDANGLPRVLHADIDLPMIVSVGLGYTTLENWLIALDARYIDYKNTDGFGDPARFDATGALSGLDWSSVMSTALGVQRKLGERLYLRAGYTFNQSPIRNSESFFNTASVLFYEHMLSCGLSYQLNEKLAVSGGYSHYFESSRTGPIVHPFFGEIPGSSITNTMSANFLSFGVLMRL
jgi:long-chain fatty acid transport protein